MAIPLYKNGSNARRRILYPCAVLVVAVLAWLGWGYEAEPDLQQRLASAELMAKTGAFDGAIRELEIVLDEDPQNLHAQLIYGLIEERRSDEEAALRCYEKARSLTDSDSLKRDLDLSMVDLERRLGRLDEALARLEKMPVDADVERLHGLIDWEAGRNDEAFARFRAALDLEPESVELKLLIAGAHIENGAAAHARAMLETLPRDDKRAGGSWKTLARLYLESGDDKSAFEALSRYVELDEVASRRLSQDEFWASKADHELLGKLVRG